MNAEYRVGEKFQEKIARIETLLEEDPVGRGIDCLRKKLIGDLERAAESVIQAKQVYILTGFFIPRVGRIETDGLSGAAFLAKALVQFDRDKFIYVLNDPHNMSILNDSLGAIGCFPTMILPNFDTPPAIWINPSEKSVLIAVERPGKGIGDKYRTMRGVEIPAYPLDEVFIEASKKQSSLKTISCADGLNEVGMGKLPRGIIAKDEKIQSVVPVDYLVISGTADWAAFGLIAALSLMTGTDLLPSKDDQERFLKAAVASGAVDGITGKSELTVDTLPLEKHQQKVEELRLILF